MMTMNHAYTYTGDAEDVAADAVDYEEGDADDNATNYPFLTSSHVPHLVWSMQCGHCALCTDSLHCTAFALGNSLA